MASASTRYSPTHSRGARTASPTIEGRRSDALRLMLAGGVTCALGAFAISWVIRFPHLVLLAWLGGAAVVLACTLFVWGLWLFIRD